MKKAIMGLMLMIVLSMSVFAANGATNGDAAAVDHEPTMAQQQDQDMTAVAAQGEQPEAAQTQKAKFFSWKAGENEPKGQFAEAASQAWERVRSRLRELFGLSEPEPEATTEG